MTNSEVGAEPAVAGRCPIGEMPAVCENTTGQEELRQNRVEVPVPPEQPVRRFRPWMAWVAPVASLFATAWVVWFAALVPQLDHMPIAALIAEAVEYSLLAWAWSAAITMGLFLAMPRPARFDAVRFTLRTSTTAVWFAPAMLSLSASSLGSLAAGTVLVASTTRMLYVHWLAIYGPAQDSGPERAAWGPAPPALATSFSLQSGALCILLGHSLAAATLLGAAAAVLTLFAARTGAWPVDRSTGLLRSIWSVLLTVMLGAALTVAGLSHRLIVNPETRWDEHSESRPGFFESARKLLDAVLYDYDEKDTDPKGHALPVYQPPEAVGEIKDTSFPGVVIWPKVKPETILVPPMPALGHGLFRLAEQPPLSVPFAGDYWLLKPPAASPPAHSLLRRGSPLDLSYRTTDHRPMWMEAHHRFDEPIELRCCSQIRLQISNGDRYFGTVSLELILIDSTRKNRPWLSLGRAPVTSIPRHAVPSLETLAFSIPAGAHLRQFNEIKVVFHRDRMRIEFSARIAIERIVFVPAGIFSR